MRPKITLFKVLSLASCLLACLAPTATGAAAGAGAKTRVLLVTGGHGFQKEPFFRLFAENLEIAVTHAEHDTKAGASAYERADLYDFDVVVAYDMTSKSTEAQRTRFKGLFERGIGYVALHHALISFDDWAGYGRILGGRYPKPPKGQPPVTDAVGYQHDVELAVKIADPAHPVAAGVTDFVLKDEIYWGTRVEKDIRPLLTTSHAKSMNPIGWTRSEGKARVVFLQLGHDRHAFENPNYRTLVAQAIRWAARKPAVSIANALLSVELDPNDATLAVTDKRTGRRSVQKAIGRGPEVASVRAGADGRTMEFVLRQAAAGAPPIAAKLRLEAELPEFTLELAAEGALPAPLHYPHPFATIPGESLVVPLNEGISYPVDDDTVKPFNLIAYGGHGICMAFWGVTDGERGHTVIIETPDDAAIRAERLDKRLAIGPRWDPQRGAFGYARRLRYVFHENGGHVAIAKRYRLHAQQTGLFRTLADKMKANPNVERLLGAVNVWCWDNDAPALVRELKAAGIERILWSNAQPPENLRALNELGVLTSRYDLYQDVMNPAEFPKLRGVHKDWTTKAWPADLMLKADGDWVRGWGVKARDGSMIPCGVLCDSRAVGYARERITAELKTHPYLGRFIDTTTASPWRECYHPEHPMTRTQSREWKMRLLEFVSRDSRLVTGCETGHDASVPHVHFFEGMLSLGPYRVPDSGRDMKRIWTEVPERVAKFQTGHGYRLPLWELVFHECVVAQWYWGDYNNKLPALWDRRDLFNLLYGTPPMFMFDRRLWTKERERFAQSYRTICPTVRQVALHEMTDHRFLTRDRAVQQTRFADGTLITVNFGAEPFTMPDGRILPPLGHNISPGTR